MQFIIKLFPEIIIKSRPVRKNLTRILGNNLRGKAKSRGALAKVKVDFEKIEMHFDVTITSKEEAVELIKTTPGISKFSESIVGEATCIEDITLFVLPLVEKRLSGKTFAVRSKRSGKHAFSSVDIERQVGSVLAQQCAVAGVNLKHPEELIELELRQDKIFLLGQTWKGLGGFPLGTQEPVLSLISGGFDSSVSSYSTMRRGMPTHFLFFNIGGHAHEQGTKEIAHFLWNKYENTQQVKFVSVPFAPVVHEISRAIPNNYLGLALKRMMYRAADRIAKQLKIKAVVLGEAIGQVSSQTLHNLELIDPLCQTVILRPLATIDKEDIIRMCRDIGTEPMASSMPEYCAMKSSKPTSHGKAQVIEAAEQGFDFSVLDNAIEQMRVTPLPILLNQPENQNEETRVQLHKHPPKRCIIIDVRHPDEALKTPLSIEQWNQQEPTLELIPYYSIQNKFAALDQNKTYVLYCDRGIMSRLHAELLFEAGHKNVGVIQG